MQNMIAIHGSFFMFFNKFPYCSLLWNQTMCLNFCKHESTYNSDLCPDELLFEILLWN